MINFTDLVFLHPRRRMFSYPENIGLRYREFTLRSKGVQLNAWLFVPPKRVHSLNTTVVHFHGNYGNMSWHFFYSAWLTRYGYKVLMFDYSGYGKSAGKASVEALNTDAAAVWNLLKRKKYKDGRVILFGQSLGGYVLLKNLPSFFPRHKIQGVILEGVFDNLRDIYAEKTLHMPVFKKTLHNFQRFIPQAHCVNYGKYRFPFPVHIFCGTEDRVVPPEISEAVYERLEGDKHIHKIPDTPHLQVFGAKQQVNRLLLVNLFRSWAEKTARGNND